MRTARQAKAPENARERAAARLFDAFSSGMPIEPLTEEVHGFDVAAAYDVQRALRDLHESAGRRVVGRKVGLTSEAIQRQLGVSQPDYGLLFDTHVWRSGSTLDPEAQHLIAPRLEAELAFVFAEDVRGPGVTLEHVLALEPQIIPVFEVIDSRITDWRIGLPDTIADNASCFGAVTGEPLALDGRDLAAAELTFLHDGRTLATGTGDAVMGNPAAAVAWLANTLASYQEPLPAGELVLSGAITAAVDLVPGRFEARFSDGLGSVVVDVQRTPGRQAA